MAGSNQAFDPAAFRTAIKNTMHMGLPSNPSERATFRWLPEKTYTKEDRNNHPYDWTSTPVSDVEHDDVLIDVAVEFKPHPQGGQTETLIGQINSERAIITALDVDYAQVVGANIVLLGGNVYNIDYWAPPIGLFEVTVYQAYLTAVDEA